ncbi:MAG: hypothetical protein HKN47_08130 [Pirellulaceae bacterium]|nr:hypothetical protein [Pirellulaceae bacterium]
MAQLTVSRSIATTLLILGVATTATAHHPNRECQQVHERVDLIGPLGNNLHPSYRRTHNRPRYIPGKLAYWFAPSSQEAMAWHKAKHRGDYKNKRPGREFHYFNPKPWESMQIGPRVSQQHNATGVQDFDSLRAYESSLDSQPLRLESDDADVPELLPPPRPSQTSDAIGSGVNDGI